LIDERAIVLSEIISNIKISKLGDFCWVDTDYPLMIGFQEYSRINACHICESNCKDLEAMALSQKMVISLQKLMLQLLE
jgi:hypothetical protein